MKKLVILIFLFLLFHNAQSQNKDIDIKHLHTPNGKEWKAMEKTEGTQASSQVMNNVFKFYSDGSIAINENSSSSLTVKESEREQKKWRYDNKTNILYWEIKSPTGEITKCQAEITFIDENRMVTNLSENGKENIIFVLIKQ